MKLFLHKNVILGNVYNLLNCQMCIKRISVMMMQFMIYHIKKVSKLKRRAGVIFCFSSKLYDNTTMCHFKIYLPRISSWIRIWWSENHSQEWMTIEKHFSPYIGKKNIWRTYDFKNVSNGQAFPFPFQK